MKGDISEGSLDRSRTAAGLVDSVIIFQQLLSIVHFNLVFDRESINKHFDDIAVVTE